MLLRCGNRKFSFPFLYLLGWRCENRNLGRSLFRKGGGFVLDPRRCDRFPLGCHLRYSGLSPGGVVSRVPLALKLICLKRVCAILLAGEVIIPTLFAPAVRLAFSVVLKPKSSWKKVLERSMGSDCRSTCTWIEVILEV